MQTIGTGDLVDDFSLHRGTRDVVSLGELVADGPAVFHFYIFDFTGSDEAG